MEKYRKVIGLKQMQIHGEGKEAPTPTTEKNIYFFLKIHFESPK